MRMSTQIERRTTAMIRELLTTVALSSILLVSGCHSKTEKNQNGSATAIKVKVAPLVERTFRDIVRVQGMIEAQEKAQVAALVPGALDSVFVDEGSLVRQGQELFQTDKANLETRVEIEKQNLKVADASVEEAKAGLRQAAASHEKAALDRDRFERLYENDKAISKDAYEKITSLYKQTAAGLDHAKAVLDLTLARKEQATSAVRIAEKQLADSRVTAPFAGVVSSRLIEPGEFAGSGVAVISLKGVSSFEARAHVAAVHFKQVVVGETRANVFSHGQNLGEFPVTLRSPTVDFQSRTFEIRVALTNAPAVTDGMACDIALILASRTGRGVASSAIGIRDGKPVVYAIEGGIAHQMSITRGIVDDTFTEILDSNALIGKNVVIEGQSFLNDNTPVRTE